MKRARLTHTARPRIDADAWTRTPEGLAAYRAAREAAQAAADADGFDRGIERNDIFHEFHTFMLPRRENRTGHELRCEVVSCSVWDKIRPGHGPK